MCAETLRPGSDLPGENGTVPDDQFVLRQRDSGSSAVPDESNSGATAEPSRIIRPSIAFKEWVRDTECPPDPGLIKKWAFREVLYICKFCKKEATFQDHEAWCVQNPERTCRICGNQGRDYFALGPALRLLGLEKFRPLVEGCPACLFAVYVLTSSAHRYQDDGPCGNPELDQEVIRWNRAAASGGCGIITSSVESELCNMVAGYQPGKWESRVRERDFFPWPGNDEHSG